MRYIDVEFIKDYYGYYTQYQSLKVGQIRTFAENIVKVLMDREIVTLVIAKKEEQKDVDNNDNDIEADKNDIEPNNANTNDKKNKNKGSAK